MKKFRIFFRFDKEEKWLEHMAETGWMLYRKAFFYHFRKIYPEQKKIRIDYREFKSRQDFADYCSLFDDSGWQHIAGTRLSGTQYFCKTNLTEGTEDIFSDSLSRAGRYKRYAGAWMCCTIVFVPYLITMINNGINLEPKAWYLTPGLWKLEGLSFWRAFLFETPFALMRGVGWMIPIVAILLFSGFALKSHLLYKSVARRNM